MSPVMHDSPEWQGMVSDVAMLKANFISNTLSLADLKGDVSEMRKDISTIKDTVSRGYGGISVGAKVGAAVVVLLTLVIGVWGLVLQIKSSTVTHSEMPPGYYVGP